MIDRPSNDDEVSSSPSGKAWGVKKGSTLIILGGMGMPLNSFFRRFSREQIIASVLAVVVVLGGVYLIVHFWPSSSRPAVASAVMPTDQSFGDLVIKNFGDLGKLAEKQDTATKAEIAARKAEADKLRQDVETLRATVATLQKQLAVQADAQKANPALLQQLEDLNTKFQKMLGETNKNVSELKGDVKALGDTVATLLDVAAKAKGAQDALLAQAKNDEDNNERQFVRINTILAMVKAPPTGSKDAANIARDTMENEEDKKIHPTPPAPVSDAKKSGEWGDGRTMFKKF